MKDRATLRDIAEMAGVSLSTASQALNNKNGVAVETRARVLKAATALGYQQQVRIAAPLTNQIATIGLLMKRDPDKRAAMDPFYYRVLQGIEDECRRLNLTLLYASVDVDEHSHVVEWPSNLPGDSAADGWIVVGAVIEHPTGLAEHAGSRPVVVVDGGIYDGTVDQINIDNLGGAYEATRHLIACGHREIGFIGGGTVAHPSILTRREGYLRALHDHDIPNSYLADSLVLGPHVAEEAAHKLLTNSPQITAICASSDFVAIGVMKTAHALGLNVPADLSVVGFDDIDMAEHTIPPLTTIQVNKPYMGALAVRQLYDSANFPDRPNVTILVNTRLIERGTVTAPSNR